MVRLTGEHREAIGAWALEALSPLRRTLERLTPAARAHFVEGWQILHQEAQSSRDDAAACGQSPGDDAAAFGAK